MSDVAQLANPLWQSMCLFSFAFLLFSWVQAHKGKIAIFDSLRYIVFLTALLAAVTFSKELFINGTSLINAEAETVSASIELFLDNAGRAGVEGENDTFAISAPVTGLVLDIMHYLAALIREFFGYFQWGIIFLLYSVSPLMFSFLAHPSTQNIGVRFLTTSFGVMMWKFGFVFADMIFIGTFNEIVADYVVAANDLAVLQFTLTESITVDGLSVNVALWLAVMLFVLVIMYFLAPLLVYLIFSGASPAGAMGAALGSAIAGAMGFSRLASTLASSRKNSLLSQNSVSSSASSHSPLAASLPPASGGMSPFSMGGLGAKEVSQRENERIS